MTTIYAWPPVRYTASLHTVSYPVRRSRGIFSGAEDISAVAAPRRMVQLTVSALAGQHRDGAGLCESMARLLAGGVNLARLVLPSVNLYRELQPFASEPFTWTSAGLGMGWTYSGTPFVWMSGPLSPGTVATDLNGFPALALSGLTPGQRVCRAFDSVKTYAAGVLLGATRALRSVVADADGNAVVSLHEPLPAGLVSIGGPEEAVFRATSMTPSAQPLNSDWSYSWSLREVLEGEIPEDAEEKNPWL